MPSTNFQSVDANQTVTITIPPTLPSILGPLFVGILLNWGLLGLLMNQVYVYYLCFPNDSRYIKAIVYIILALEIAQTCMLSSDGWNWLISAWGRPAQLEAYHLAWIDVPIFVGIMSGTVQLFFAWRIWLLSKSWILPCCITLISLMQSSASMASGVKLRLLPSFAQIGALSASISVWHIGSASADIIIAISMTYLLMTAKGSYARTNYLLERLVKMTVETGSITATMGVVDLVLFLVFKNTNLHVAPAIILAKLYSNTLMAIFNNRIYLRVNTPGSRGHTSQSYGSRFRDAMSGDIIRDQAHSVSFADTFMESTPKEGIPLAPVTFPSGQTTQANAPEKNSAPMVFIHREQQYL